MRVILTAALIVAASTPAMASDIFSRIDGALSKAERAMDTTDRTLSRSERMKERVSDKVPTGNKNLSAKEHETLRKAQEIEERRILREAEAIRNRR